jgi:hypothetical protein
MNIFSINENLLVLGVHVFKLFRKLVEISLTPTCSLSMRSLDNRKPCISYYIKFHCDISMYICIITQIGSFPLFSPWSPNICTSYFSFLLGVCEVEAKTEIRIQIKMHFYLFLQYWRLNHGFTLPVQVLYHLSLNLIPFHFFSLQILLKLASNQSLLLLLPEYLDDRHASF